MKFHARNVYIAISHANLAREYILMRNLVYIRFLKARMYILYARKEQCDVRIYISLFLALKSALEDEDET